MSLVIFTLEADGGGIIVGTRLCISINSALVGLLRIAGGGGGFNFSNGGSGSGDQEKSNVEYPGFEAKVRRILKAIARW